MTKTKLTTNANYFMIKLDDIIRDLGIDYVPIIETKNDYIDTIHAIIQLLKKFPEKQKVITMAECRALLNEIQSTKDE